MSRRRSNPIQSVSTTDPNQTMKPIPEEYKDRFLEEISTYDPRLGKFRSKQMFRCASLCDDGTVMRATSNCPKCAGQLKRNPLFETLWNKAVYGARRRDIPWLLTHEEFCDLCSIETCFYCEKDLNRYELVGIGGCKAVLIDRRDSDGPYSRENCVPCCADCNKKKGFAFSPVEMLLVSLFNQYFPDLDLFRQEELKLFVDQQLSSERGRLSEILLTWLRILEEEHHGTKKSEPPKAG